MPGLGLQVDKFFPIDQSYDDQQGDTASVTGGLDLHGGLDVAFSHHLLAHPTHPVDIKLTASVNEQFNGAFQADSQRSYDDHPLLGSVELPPVEAVVLGVPVVVDSTVTANLDFAATFHGGMSASVNQARGYEASLTYHGGTWSSSANPTSQPAAFTGPSGEGTASVKVGVNLKLSMLLYGEAGPNLSLEPYLRLSTDLCGVTLYGGIEAGIGITLNGPLGDKSFETELASPEAALLTTGYHCTWDGTLHSDQSGSGGTCDFVTSCGFDIHATFTPTLSEEKLAPNATDDFWEAVFGFDYTIDYFTDFDTSGGSCTKWVTTTGTLSGHRDLASAAGSLTFNNGAGGPKYSAELTIVAIPVTEHFFASGPAADGCDNFDFTQDTTVDWQSDVPIDDDQGVPALDGSLPTTESGNSIPLVHTWHLVRHLPF